MIIIIISISFDVICIMGIESKGTIKDKPQHKILSQTRQSSAAATSTTDA